MIGATTGKSAVPITTPGKKQDGLNEKSGRMSEHLGQSGWSGMALVRRIYKVPAYRGRQIVFTGLKHPVAGRIISCDGSYLWIWTNDGRRFGPLHPTWEIDYGE